jgi:uncharacterized protein involved in exopolysaccharide biosynthesis
MRRALEIVFSHWIQIIALLVTPIVIALAIVFVQPREYEASTTIWANQRYSVIGATGPETDQFATPSATQATALMELLQTRTFDLSIAQESNLASIFDSATRADSDKLDDAIVHELSTQVTATPIGDHLYQITYDNKNPQIAKQVISAVVDQFGALATGFSATQAKQFIQIYQQQLAQAQKAANAATQAAANYAVDHPAATAQTDATYSGLLRQAQGTQATVDSLQGQITQLNQQLVTTADGSNSLYRVVDKPRVDSKPISRMKTLALGGGLGVAVGLLAVTLLFMALMRRDRSAYSADELRRFTGLPVALEVPHLPDALLAGATRTRSTIPGSAISGSALPKRVNAPG